MSLTIEAIYSRCEEVGECMEWTGTAVDGKHPRVFAGGRWLMVRRVVSSLFKDAPVPPLARCGSSCGSNLCVRAEHIVWRSYKQVGKAMSKSGVCSSAAARAGKRAARRSRSKLTPEKVQAILASTDSSSKEGLKHGVSGSTIRKVRAGQIWTEHLHGASVFTFRPELLEAA
jgi:hypothetical protein